MAERVQQAIPVLAIGHIHPDTDAVCSALAYAAYYEGMSGERTVACYLDELAPETRWVLEHFQLAAPLAITDVYLHVQDVMERDIPHLHPEQTLREAGLLMQRRGVGALPVVDDRNMLIGLLARDALANRYLEQLHLADEVDVLVAPLVETLHATLLAGDVAGALRQRAWIATMDAAAAAQTTQPGDIVIVGDQPDVQRAAIGAGAACIIVSGGAPVAADVVEGATVQGVVLLRTPMSPFGAALLLQQSVSVAWAMNNDPPCCRADDLLSEAQAQLRQAGLSSLPVVNEVGELQGMLLRRHLTTQARRRVILTDHNHPDQTAPGVTESEIVAIVDHHNLGGLQTLKPLTILCEPVGSTCSLIAELFRRSERPLEGALAGGMLAAILSDTVHFRSPTTTPRDREIAAWLETRSGADASSLAHAMFRARLPRPTPPAAWWVESNLKTYTFGQHAVSIGQVELTDIEMVMPPVDALKAELARVSQQHSLLTAMLLLTDILGEYSLLVAADAEGERIGTAAFDVQFAHGYARLDGVMSRKQQVVPPIAAVVLGQA